MNINKKILLASVLAAPLLAFGSVAAQERQETTSDEPTTQTKEETRTGNEGLTLQERLQKRKETLQTRLNNAQKLRLATRCKAAQGQVSRIKQRLGNVISSRGTVYGNLIERLNTLAGKLKNQGIDTAELEKQISELETKIATFHTDLAKYEEAISDLADMDCTADPEGFQASLQEARTLRIQAVNDGQAIHAYLKDTIKKTLQTIRSQLETKEGSDQ